VSDHEKVRVEPDVASKPFHLNGERPRVTRLSRRALTVGGATFGILIGAVVAYSLKTRQVEQSSDERHDTEHHSVADGLSKLPLDYSSAPRNVTPLGPPAPVGFRLPANGGEMGSVTIDVEQQHANQEAEAARTSKLFTSTSTVASVTNQKTDPIADKATSTDESFAQNGQDRKLAFAAMAVDRRTLTTDRISSPASPFIVQAGTAIPAALMTGIRSDLPGQIIAQVTENIYDSPTGRARLIPQGSRLIGVYDSQVAFGQSRVQLVWTRLILPNGRSVVLERQLGTDASGYAGLQDGVDNHWAELFKAALLSTVLGVGSELGSGADGGNNASVLQALRLGAATTLNQTGDQVVRRNLNVQPTLTIRPGFPLRVMVNRDLVLEPYRN
jgi:type IV secretion system protein TrbI